MRVPHGKPRGSDRITYAEAADILGVTVTTIVRWVAAGTLPAWRTKGGQHKLWRSVVLGFAEERRKARGDSNC